MYYKALETSASIVNRLPRWIYGRSILLNIIFKEMVLSLQRDVDKL